MSGLPRPFGGVVIDTVPNSERREDFKCDPTGSKDGVEPRPAGEPEAPASSLSPHVLATKALLGHGER